MKQFVPYLVAFLALVIGGLGALMAVGFLVAGSPNSSPAQLRVLKGFMLAFTVLGLGCGITSIVLMIKHHPWWAAIVGVTPAVVFVVAFIAEYVRESMQP